jgi:phage/plasmid-like protein (TIGR03299 family)
MAHEVEQMAYVGQVPWHGLGNNLSPGSSIEEWQHAAGLDWQVSKRPVQYRNDDGLGGMSLTNYKDKFVLARDTDHRPYAVVSDRYKPVQPKQILEFFRDLIADFGMTIETAGSLRDGQRVWALAKTGNVHEVLGVDKVDSYLMLATSYDLTFSTLAQFTSVRVVCNNTLQQSFSNHSARVTIPHFRDFNEGDVKAELGAGFEQWDKFAKSMDDLAWLQLDTVKAHEVLTRIFPLTNDPLKDSVNNGHIAKVEELFAGKAIGADIAGQTGWGLVNAVTEYLDQHRRARNQGNRLDSAWFGDGFITKQRAYDELMKLLT